jgi:hypothetical protein
MDHEEAEEQGRDGEAQMISVELLQVEVTAFHRN